MCLSPLVVMIPGQFVVVACHNSSMGEEWKAVLRIAGGETWFVSFKSKSVVITISLS